MANLLQKWFSDRVFYVTIADTDVESLKSLHTLFDKYLDNMLVIWTKPYGPNYIKFWSFWQKWLTIFDKVLAPFWKMFLWMKQLFDAKLLIKKITVVRHV